MQTAAAAAARLQLLLADDHFSTLQSTRHMGTPQNAISNNSRSRLQHVLVVIGVGGGCAPSGAGAAACAAAMTAAHAARISNVKVFVS